MSTPPGLGTLSNDTLASLVFELASQLHIERMSRLALEAALLDRGLLTPADLQSAGMSPSLQHNAHSAADHSIRALLRILSEAHELHAPMRAQAPAP